MTASLRIDRHRVWANAATVSALTAVVKIAGAVKTAVIARYFGAGAELDAYLLAFLVPSFMAEVLCGSIVPALVPCLIELHHHQKDRAAIDVSAGAIRRSLIFVGAIAAVLAVFAGLSIAWHSASPQFALTLMLFLLMLPILPISAASNVWRAVLNANGRFVAAAGASALTPVAIVLSLAIIGRDVCWLAAATTSGALAESIALALAVRSLDLPLFSGASPSSRSSSIALRQYGALAVANLVTGGSLFLDQSMAAMLGAGAVSLLNYGTRLTAVLIAIGPEALGITLLPRFSQMMMQRGQQQVRSLMNRFLLITMCASIVPTVILIAISQPVVQLAFQHGAFVAHQTLAVASVQKLSLLQLPFTVGVALLTRLIASARTNRILVPISAAGLALNALLNLLFMRQFSVAGIALATSLSQAAVFTLLLIAASRIQRASETSVC